MMNPYIPYPARVKDITIENGQRDLKTFALAFEREEDEKGFSYLPGQFCQLSLFGKGEAPFGIASSPTEQGGLLLTLKKAGLLTAELHNAEAGQKVGVRGPLGIPFPWERMEGKDIVIVGGGFAFTTLRSAIVYMLDDSNRNRFGTIMAIYGARNPGELLYKNTLDEWARNDSIDLHVTVDEADDNWSGKVGLVTTLLDNIAPSSSNAIALVCGPPVMIKFTILSLKRLEFSEEDIILSLEMRMKCGIGKCGRCNIGSKYVCTDGPVFTYRELQELPAEY